MSHLVSEALSDGGVADSDSLRTALDIPPDVATAIALVADELLAVETELHALLQSTIAIIPEVGGHLAFAGGKRFRPLVTLLAARAAGFHDPSRITIAAVGELLHTATLLHDDVIDEGHFRRGRPTARVCYGNGMAVLTGDYCFARSLQAVAHTGRIDAVRTLSSAVTRMAEGEIAQLHVAGDIDTNRERYYMVIDRKTAALIAWCTSLAGLIDVQHGAGLERYGLELGYAFQIADDVLDYAYDMRQTGKARGQDLRDGKLTLPLLLACEADAGTREKVRHAFTKGPPIPERIVSEIIERVISSGTLERCAVIAEQHALQAIHALDGLPASAAREALVAVAAYVARRTS